jgi:hypothetical protein
VWLQPHRYGETAVEIIGVCAICNGFLGR